MKACASQQVGEGGKKMVALLLLAQGDNSMLATQKRVRAKKSGEEAKRNKVRIHGIIYVGVVDSFRASEEVVGLALLQRLQWREEGSIEWRPYNIATLSLVLLRT